MKKLIASLTVVLLTLGSVGAVMAATDTSSLTVTASAVDKLSVDDATGVITLDGTAGSDALTGADNTAADLRYTHNSSGTKKITAQVTTDPAGDDITLTVQVQGGESAQEICTAGTATAAKDVYTALARGTINNKTVTYSAAATASGTVAGDYVFVITFTSADE